MSVIINGPDVSLITPHTHVCDVLSGVCCVVPACSVEC